MGIKKKLYIDDVIKTTSGMNVKSRLGTFRNNVIAYVGDSPIV